MVNKDDKSFKSASKSPKGMEHTGLNRLGKPGKKIQEIATKSHEEISALKESQIGIPWNCRFKSRAVRKTVPILVKQPL